jgi:hypothetical protein
LIQEFLEFVLPIWMDDHSQTSDIRNAISRNFVRKCRFGLPGWSDDRSDGIRLA